MKSRQLLVLLSSVLQDCKAHCGTNTTRDFKTITRRVEQEGVSFLTITLGDFASDFELSLENRQISPTSFRAFKKMKKAASIPSLFSGMMRQVFDLDGNLLNEPSIAAIFCIRQVCRMWKKILLPCSEARQSKAVDDYVKVEKELSMLDIYSPTEKLFSEFDRVAAMLWSKVLAPVSQEIEALTHIPRHGRGAVSLKTLQNQKYVWGEWHQRLEQFFPSSSFCYNSEMSFLEHADKIVYLSPEQERPVRVVFVPKTLKSPRVIGIEPTCMQYTQQSLLSLIVKRLESCVHTKGHVNFTKQDINAKLALKSSKDGFLATLDLSEASDRVHSGLVERMLRSVPIVRDAIFACRSTNAVLPNGINIPLRKFASMGSALCFPIESMVFFTILTLAEIKRRKLPLVQKSIDIVRSDIYVYGDDLIIPTETVPLATMLLELFGLKVNFRKSFFKGNFRESCGMDAYSGVDVTTIYLRRMLPSSKHDVRGYVSAVAFSNQLAKAGFYHTTGYIETLLQEIGWRTPIVTETSSCVGYVRLGEPLTVHRYNKDLHRSEVKGLVVVVKQRDDKIDGHHALMKWFLQGLNPNQDHYKQSVDSGRLTVKARWCKV